ncbi:DUF4169 family protein [Tritonibacter scottomollicae]|uniref:DUF4169 family protein n=1 Tax=Tritonibacter scottomollicae TaxID=483013 RepID=A0A2T1AF73_TRISK|nr:DUF4169 family protein [Tritonibacter scottomollicae]PRZ47187.1 uncharacterized protein DUF4169 [Tritonibacter scottomollicae]WOI34035.1 DUF4169 family protein [Tritonibacter scottomollicae]
MGKPVNLNRFRKQKARAEKKARADQNVVKYGRTKTEKARDKADEARDKTLIDQHKLDHGDE